MRFSVRPSSKVEITKQRALRRQVFGNITPCIRAQHIHEAVHDFRGSTERLRPPRWPEDQGSNRPLIVRQIAGITSCHDVLGAVSTSTSAALLESAAALNHK